MPKNIYRLEDFSNAEIDLLFPKHHLEHNPRSQKLKYLEVGKLRLFDGLQGGEQAISAQTRALRVSGRRDFVPLDARAMRLLVFDPEGEELLNLLVQELDYSQFDLVGSTLKPNTMIDVVNREPDQLIRVFPGKGWVTISVTKVVRTPVLVQLV